MAKSESDVARVARDLSSLALFEPGVFVCACELNDVSNKTIKRTTIIKPLIALIVYLSLVIPF